MKKTTINKQTDFFYQLQNYGIRKILSSLDFKIFVLALVTLSIDRYFQLELSNLFITTNESSSTYETQSIYVTAILAAAATLFALTITALSIILSFSSSSFVNFLNDKSLLSDILFPFWLGNGAYLLSACFALIYLILGPQLLFLSDYLLILLIATFFYAIVSTFYLLATIIRFGFFLSLYEQEK